jgi:hypothetical protein
METNQRKQRGPAHDWREVVACGCFFLFVAGHLLWSSPGYRMTHLLLGCVAALLCAGPAARSVVWRSGWAGLLCGAGLLVAQGAAWWGGVMQGTPPWEASRMALAGLIGVAGLVFWSAGYVHAPPPRWMRRTGYGVLVLVLVSSLAGYVLVIERHIPLGGAPEWFDRTRLAAIWPTRLLMTWMGQIAWLNTNVAGYGFALAMAVVLEGMARGGGGRWRWLLCAGLAAAVYLTASRGAGLMLLLSLPVVLLGRRGRFCALAAAALVAGGMAGHAMLKFKHARLATPTAETAGIDKDLGLPRVVAVTDAHHADYLKRRDAGRLPAYRALWAEGAESRWFGQGLAAAGKPVLYLNQEHSSFLATLRCGGLVAAGGHVLILAVAAWSALRLLRQGIRWPAVLLLAALGGLLFDRSSVLPLTGYPEFPAHWLAVWLPVLRAGLQGPWEKERQMNIFKSWRRHPDNSVTPGIAYHYVVAITGGVGTGSVSAVASAAAPPGFTE